MVAEACGLYTQKGNGMTAYNEAYGEYCIHGVVPFAEVVLVRIPKPTHRGLQGGRRWHKGDAVLIKGVWGGRSETSDEHMVLTPGGRALAKDSKSGAVTSTWTPAMTCHTKTCVPSPGKAGKGAGKKGPNESGPWHRGNKELMNGRVAREMTEVRREARRGSEGSKPDWYSDKDKGSKGKGKGKSKGKSETRYCYD